MSKLRNPFADPTQRKVLTGDFIGSKEWHRRATFEEQIIAYCLEKGFSAEDFISYFNSKIAPSLAKIYKNREEQKKKLQQEFAAKKAKEQLPENRLPEAFFARKAYPNLLPKVIKKYTQQDFIKVYNMAINGQLDNKLKESKIPFIQWVSGVIKQKEAETQSTKEKILNALKR